MSGTDKRDPTHYRRAEDAIRASSQSAQLAEAAMSLLGCRTADDVYLVVCDFMTRLSPGVVVVVDEITPSIDCIITRAFAGVDGTVAARVAELVGFDIIGKRWAIPADLRRELLSGEFVKIPGGFADLASLDIPRKVAAAMTRVFGIHDLYVVGIADGNSVLGNFAVLTRAPNVVLPTSIIESFAHHCYSALEGINHANELADTANRGRLMFDTMSEGLALHEIILDDDGKPCDYRFLDVNPAFEATTGLKAKDIIGRTVLEVLPNTEPIWIKRYGEVATTGMPARFEEYASELGRYYEISAYCPQPGQFVSLGSDVTDRRRAQDELIAAEARSRAIISGLPVPMAVNSEDQRVTFLNPAFTETFGYAVDDIPDLDRWWSKAYPDPEYREAVASAWVAELERAKATGTPFSPQTVTVRCKDGTDRVILASAASLFGSFEGSHLVALYDITDRETALRALASSEAKFATAFHTSPDAVAINRTSDGLYIDVNDGFCRLTGYAPDEVVGRTSREIDIWADTADRERLVEGLRTGGAVDNLEAGFRRKDGSITSALMSARVVDIDGERCTLSITKDISDRKQAEVALRESEERFRAVFEGANDGIFLLSVEGEFMSVNPAFARLHGYEVDEMLAMGLADLEGPKTEHLLDERLRRVLAGETLTFEVEHLRKDGRTVPLEVSTNLVTIGDHSVVLAFHRDIAERKAAEEALQEREWRLTSIIEGTHIGTWQWNVQTGVSIFNDEWAQMLGYTLDELSPTGILTEEALAHPEDLARSNKELERHFAGETPFYNCELRLRHKDGHWIWVQDRGRVITRTEDGKPLMMFGTHTDITERREAEEALRKSEEKYRRITESVSDVVWILDPQTLRFTYVSPSVHKLRGFTPEEILAEPLDAAMTPDAAQMVRRLLHRRVKDLVSGDMPTGISFTEQLEQPCKDGSTVWTEVVTSYHFNAETGLPEVHGVTRDITERRRDLERLRRALSSIVEIVGQVVETRDPYTAGHQRRVSELAVRISQEMGMDAPTVEEIRTAALLHDVGKMSVPAEILSKPGALSVVEFELIKAHSESGYRIISSANMEGPTAEIVYQHHERCDGSGYPRGLKSEDLLPASRVLMVADVVEAMMSHRPYRAALGVEAALEEIDRGCGTLYDAVVCKACSAVFRDRDFAFSET
jgi:PAS domain S-box-containing protein/putative nucleotidyltransferase with HDIG domain